MKSRSNRMEWFSNYRFSIILSICSIFIIPEIKNQNGTIFPNQLLMPILTPIFVFEQFGKRVFRQTYGKLR